MNYIGKFISNFKEFYNEINSATLTGAIDVIVVQQKDGSFQSSPFHVRFGKMGVLRSKEKIVDIEVNGKTVDVHMKLGDSGEAFFVQEVENFGESLGILATSPIPTFGNFDEEMQKLSLLRDERFTYEDKKSQFNSNGLDESCEVVSGSSYSSGEKAVQTDFVANDHTYHKQPSIVASQGSDDVEPLNTAASEDKKSKKKRKRKAAAARRRRSPSKDSSISSTASESKASTCEILNEEIFPMEDDYHHEECDEPKGVPRTFSLPQLTNKDSNSEDSGDNKVDIDFVRSRSYSISYPRECHPFSDGDFSPMLSPRSSRPPSPKSDTEYEREIIKKTDAVIQTDDSEIQWTWGELPNLPSPVKSPQTNSANENTNFNDANLEEGSQQKSVLGGMFRFMRKTKKLRHQPQSEGIYLDDLNLDDLDPEIAALYFPARHSGPVNINACDEDNESGNGTSLPQSPHSVEGAPGCPASSGIDSDNEETRQTYLNSHFDDIAMSLCGGLQDENSDIPEEKFLHSLVTYDDFCHNPATLFNPDLVFRINKKYYNWNSASPLIMSLVMYQRPLPARTACNLLKDSMPKKEISTGYSSWFPWSRSNKKSTKSEGDKKDEQLVAETVVDIEETNLSVTVEVKNQSPPPLSVSDANEVLDLVIEGHSENVNPEMERYKKSLRLTCEQIAQLNLQNGANEVMFSVTTALQGTTRCKCHIFLWKHNDTIVISDIDGTITKSDVLGHILPIIGKDWAQSGVAQLFSKIKRNGYQFLYLSARPIGQAKITREYLKSVRQGDVSLPDGPLLLSPKSLLTAFHTEVIVKNPEEFKKHCLSDIANLFPKNPFYAGFGNKINDTWAYTAVGVPMPRIFTINHRGELRHQLTLSFQSSYTSLSDVCDHVFPPLPDISSAEPYSVCLLGSCAPDGRLDAAEYSSFVHWREPLPAIENENLEDSSKSND